MKFATGAGNGDIWLSMQRVNAGSSSFDTVGQFTGVTDGAWREVTANYVMPNADTAFLYFETAYPSGTPASFLVDDIVVESLAPPEIEDITPVKDTVDFNIGVAIDSRETAGSAADLLLRHFDQVTPENHMKPEAWYDAARPSGSIPRRRRSWTSPHANGLDVYGHTLVWHSQTPAWFFETDAGTPLTDSEADRTILRDRMRDHIFSIADALSTEYGLFGSDTNPLVAWDVVNEVVSDGTTEPTGCAAAGGTTCSARSTSISPSRMPTRHSTRCTRRRGRSASRSGDQRLQHRAGRQASTPARPRRAAAGRGAPVDAVGHQFHLSLSTPVGSLEDALVAFEDLPVTQVVSELDVTTGTPVTAALLIDQGYYYRDAFRIFRAHTDDLFSVTLWGLTDNRSWRVGAGDPLLFNAELQAKPAYHGAVDGELPPPTVGVRVQLRHRPEHGVARMGVAAAPRDRWRHRVPAAMGHRLPRRRTSRWPMRRSMLPTRSRFFSRSDLHRPSRRNRRHARRRLAESRPVGPRVVELPLPGAALGQLVDFDVQVSDGVVTTDGTSRVRSARSRSSNRCRTPKPSAPSAPVVDGGIDSVWIPPTRCRPTCSSKAPTGPPPTCARSGTTARSTSSPRSPTPRPT